MFKHMYIEEYLYDGASETSTKINQGVIQKIWSHQENYWNICLIKNNPNTGHYGNHKANYVDFPSDELALTYIISNKSHSKEQYKLLSDSGKKHLAYSPRKKQ